MLPGTIAPEPRASDTDLREARARLHVGGAGAR